MLRSYIQVFFFANFDRCCVIRFIRRRRCATPDVRRGREYFRHKHHLQHSQREIPFRNEGKVTSTADRRTVLGGECRRTIPSFQIQPYQHLLYPTSQARFIVSVNLQLQIRINQSWNSE